MQQTEPRKVYIISPDIYYIKMFERDDRYVITHDFNEADLIQFTGGEDVSPILYGEQRHRATRANPARDKREKLFYEIALKKNKPMAGICRGGQLLNVLNGGWLWQDVNNHESDGHLVTDCMTGEVYIASSSHHQMMRPGKHGKLLATSGESTYREWCTKEGTEHTIMCNPKLNNDPEVVWYALTNCMCVQYHPEYPGWEALADRYLNLIESYCFGHRFDGKIKTN